MHGPFCPFSFIPFPSSGDLIDSILSLFRVSKRKTTLVAPTILRGKYREATLLSGKNRKIKDPGAGAQSSSKRGPARIRHAVLEQACGSNRHATEGSKCLVLEQVRHMKQVCDH
jgi:hypothetical protein